MIALTNASGSVVAKYSYDAWGKVTAVKDASGNAITSSTHIGNINPIRYRGYYYDSDIQLYYLQSRYYDPDVGRFINADAAEFTTMSAVQVNDTNLFAYCGNDPINHTDETGMLWDVIANAAVGAITSVVTSAIATKAAGQKYTLGDALVAAGTGAINAVAKNTPIGWALTGFAAIANGIYTGVKCHVEGASIGASLSCAILAAGLTAVGSSAILNAIQPGVATIGLGVGLNVTFGMGMQVTNSITTGLATNKFRPTSPSSNTTNARQSTCCSNTGVAYKPSQSISNLQTVSRYNVIAYAV